MVNYRAETESLDSGFENLCSDCVNRRCTNPIGVFTHEDRSRRLWRKYDSNKPLVERTKDDYCVVLNCGGYETVKLGVKRLLLTRKACDVTAIVNIDQASREIFLYDKRGKLGIVQGCLQQDTELFKRANGGIIKFRSKRPIKDKEHGRIFFPYTENYPLESSKLESFLDPYDTQYP